MEIMVMKKPSSTEYVLGKAKQHNELYLALVTAVALSVSVTEDEITKEETGEGNPSAYFSLDGNVYYFSKVSDSEVLVTYYLTGVAEASIEERVNSLDSYQAIADRINGSLTDAHGVSELKILSKLYDLLYYHFDRMEYRIIDGKYHITTRKEKIEIEYTLTKDNKSVYTLEAIRVPEVFAEVTHPAMLKLERLYSSNANAVVDLAFNMMRYHFSCSLAVNGRPKTRCPSSIHWL